MSPSPDPTRRRNQASHRYLPVFFSQENERLFYAGFCKQILWPLFHSSPPTTEDMIMIHAFEEGDDHGGGFPGCWAQMTTY